MFWDGTILGKSLDFYGVGFKGEEENMENMEEEEGEEEEENERKQFLTAYNHKEERKRG